LRAPLRAMQSYSQAVMEDFGANIPEEGRHYLQRVLDNARRLDKMILDLLTFSRVARADLKMERICLSKLLRELLHQNALVQSSGAEVEVGELLDVLGHEPSLSQVLSNLIDNAVKFVRPGLRPKIKIWTQRKKGQITIWIEDNGIGIDPRYQHRLFNMFERLHPKLGYEGTGVGLAIVRKAIERMGGKVGVESDGVNGSRFWMVLPEAR
jgi:signal transduction histidine kinase